jgi:Acyl-coenzyme A:6-aminopenicillanic acid acyl-transferase
MKRLTVCQAGGASFTSLCYAGKLPGTALAVNSHGLVQAINDVRPLGWQVGVPRGLLAREILRCRDCRSAVELITRTPRASGYHHALGCLSDQSVYSVEASSTGISVVEVRGPQVHANHLNHRAFDSVRQYVVGGSRFRQAHGESIVAVARANPRAALQGVDSRGRTVLQLPTLENDWHKTIASAVFEIGRTDLIWHALRSTGEVMVRGHVVLRRCTMPKSVELASEWGIQDCGRSGKGVYTLRRRGYGRTGTTACAASEVGFVSRVRRLHKPGNEIRRKSRSKRRFPLSCDQ